VKTRTMRLTACALGILSGTVAFLMIPLLFLAKALTWDHQAGMQPSDWALQAVWGYTTLRGVSQIGMLYLGTRASWHAGAGRKPPKLLLRSWMAFICASIFFAVVGALALRAKLATYEISGAAGSETVVVTLLRSFVSLPLALALACGLTVLVAGRRDMK
jgi:hypothetical protein